MTAIIPWRTPFPFFSGPTDTGYNPWTARVDGLTQLDANSASIVSYLGQMIKNYPLGTGQSVPVYYVPAGQPMVPVAVQESYMPFAPFIESVPIPPGALPSTGADHYLCIVQQSNLWELWEAVYSATSGWSCTLGIKRQHILTDNPGFSRNVTTSAGVVLEQPLWGVAASKMSLCGGLTQIAELQAGEINHALGLIVHDARQGSWAYPAQFSDGQDTNASSIPYGAHFRVDPTLNIPALKIDPVMTMFAIAAQKYGMIAMDRTMVGSGFSIEASAQQSTKQGYSIWGQAPFNAGVWANFPWAHLQLLPMDLRTTQDTTLYYETQN